MAAQVLSYVPTDADAARFWDKVGNIDHSSKPALPRGYPAELHSPLAWTAEEAEKNSSQWVLELGEEDVKAIDAALAGFEARFGGDLSSISSETFVLPASTVKHLRQVSDQCYHGIGFKVLRGLNPAKYSPAQNTAVFAGIAAHVAPQRGFVDTHYEKVISHIVNVASGKPHSEVKAAPGFTDSALSFHTDNCEILGLYCLEAAATGGATLLASSWNLYNKLLALRPDVLEELTKEWVFDTFRDYEIAPPRHRRPLDFPAHDRVSLRFNRYGMTGWQRRRDPGLPAPTRRQAEAMDAVQFVAAADCVRLALRAGDVLFVNDAAVMHGREAFDEGAGGQEGGEEGERPPRRRHLLKMLLRDPAQDWPVPASARADWLRMYGPNRPDGSRSEGWDVAFQAGNEGRSLDNG